MNANKPAKTAMTKLTWGLVIATYNREKILPECLKLAIAQTRPPSEIIVVDASAHWEATRDRVMAEIASAALPLRWVYEKAVQPGLTQQRNQGIDRATADVVFLIDDDSLMYSTCAEEIMRVYEADSGGEVCGVQASLVDQPPSEVTIADERKQTGWSPSQNLSANRLRRWIWRYLFLMNAEELWIAYDGAMPQHKLPDSIAQLEVCPMPLFHGCRMTYRREAIAQTKFESMLWAYASLEDLDASYRASQRGILVEATAAKLHHFNSSSGRLSRYQVSALSALNQVACLKKYSNNLERDRRKFYLLMARRILAELCKDLLSRRWTLPQMRGLLTAWRQADRIFATPSNQLDQWYPAFQKALVAGQSLPVAAIAEAINPSNTDLPSQPAKLS